jgi:hypothetical protein
MLFALSTDDRTLMVFGDAADAVAYCEGRDVAEGGWRFWDAAGSPTQGATNAGQGDLGERVP